MEKDRTRNERGRETLCQGVMELAHQGDRRVAAEDGAAADGLREGVQALEVDVSAHLVERRYRTRLKSPVTRRSVLSAVHKWYEIGQSIFTIEME